MELLRDSEWILKQLEDFEMYHDNLLSNKDTYEDALQILAEFLSEQGTHVRTLVEELNDFQYPDPELDEHLAKLHIALKGVIDLIKDQPYLTDIVMRLGDHIDDYFKKKIKREDYEYYPYEKYQKEESLSKSGAKIKQLNEHEWAVFIGNQLIRGGFQTRESANDWVNGILEKTKNELKKVKDEYVGTLSKRRFLNENLFEIAQARIEEEPDPEITAIRKQIGFLKSMAGHLYDDKDIREFENRLHGEALLSDVSDEILQSAIKSIETLKRRTDWFHELQKQKEVEELHQKDVDKLLDMTSSLVIKNEKMRHIE